MRHIIFIFTVLLFICPQVFPEVNTSFRKKEKPLQVEKEKTINTTKSVYDKLFKDKNRHSVSRGVINVHKYEEKLYLEMPLTLMGREFLVNPVITASSDLKMPLGIPAAKPHYVIVEKSDSLILFTMPGTYTRVAETFGDLKDAFSLSKTNAIGRAFPVKGFTADSTWVLFEVTSFFTGSNPDMLTLKGRNYDGLINIGNSVMLDKVSYIEKIAVYGNCISITEAATLQLTLSVIGLDYPDKPEVSVSLQMVMALLPQEKMKPREANPYIGSGTIAYQDYRDVNRIKTGYFATRRDISWQKPVVFYLDTLLKPSWKEAIRKSAVEWNRVFFKIGLGNPIVLREYGEDSLFIAENPLINTIKFLDYERYDITFSNITDPRTGEILSTKIGIPRNFPFLIRRRGAYLMAETDERFRTYYISDELVCEGLTAYTLRAFGLSLGLVTNLAGSMAYSPEQLRSPEFTQENGITASIMDDVLYNYLTRPGDREKGVALVVSKPGICDEFVLQYLYAPINGDEEKTLKKRVLQHNGNPLYFYGDSRSTGANDPRCQLNDLGNDPFLLADIKIGHLKYFVENSFLWLDRDDIPQSYMELIQDYVYLEFYRSMQTLLSYIGGVYVNIPDSITAHLVYLPVPAHIQRKAVRKIIEIYGDLTWMDNRNFLSLREANTSLSNYIHLNIKDPVSLLMERLSKMEIGMEKSKGIDRYTQLDFLNDVEMYIFNEVISEKPLSEKKIVYISEYINGLISVSPTLNALQKTVKNTHIGSVSLTANDFFLSDLKYMMNYDKGITNSATDNAIWNLEFVASLRFTGKENIELLCYEKLSDACSLLRIALSHTNDQIIRGKIMFLMMTINRVLFRGKIE